MDLELDDDIDLNELPEDEETLTDSDDTIIEETPEESIETIEVEAEPETFEETPEELSTDEVLSDFEEFKTR